MEPKEIIKLLVSIIMRLVKVDKIGVVRCNCKYGEIIGLVSNERQALSIALKTNVEEG